MFGKNQKINFLVLFDSWNVDVKSFAYEKT